MSTDNRYALYLSHRLELADYEIIDLKSEVFSLENEVKDKQLDCVKQANLINELKQDNAKVKGLEQDIEQFVNNNKDLDSIIERLNIEIYNMNRE